MILASQSPRRRQLLEEAGFALKIRPADIDEAARPCFTFCTIASCAFTTRA